KPFPNRRPGNPVDLAIWRHTEPETFPPVDRIATARKYFVPDVLLAKSFPWRKLAVKVAPDRDQAFLQGESIGEMTGEALGGSAEKLTETFPGAVAKQTYSARHGLGLYVYKGRASFRWVSVDPRVE